MKVHIDWTHIQNSVVIRDTKKHINTLWFLIPTQLFIQGQWWSILSTHLSQTRQWRALIVLTHSQEAQSLRGSTTCIKDKKSWFLGFWTKPGSENWTRNQKNTVITPKTIGVMHMSHWFWRGKIIAKFEKKTKSKKMRKAADIFISFVDLVSVLFSCKHEHLDS